MIGDAEICKLVGVYIFNVLGEKYGKERVGLYRDDGLACFQNVSVQQANKIRKDVIKIFKQRIGPQYDLWSKSQNCLFFRCNLKSFNGKNQSYDKPDKDLL